MQYSQKYANEATDIMTRYDMGTLTDYELACQLANAAIEFGDKKTGESIMAKIDNMAKDFANNLVANLMKSDYVHVNGCIVEFVRSFLYDEYTPKQFVEHCIDCWDNSDRVTDHAFGAKTFRLWNEKFENIAGVLYVGAAGKLAEAMP